MSPDRFRTRRPAPAIPSDPSLVGAVVGAQALSASPPLTLLGFIASNGVLLTVGVQ
jgi:hypothetical protein